MLSEILGKEIILLDGGMGTQLETYDLSGGGHNSIEHPDKVLEVHKKYVRAGSRCLITNTLTMNRIYMEAHGITHSVEAVNRAAVRLARDAAGDEAYVLGNLSSTGQMLEPYGSGTEPEFVRNFTEQARYLAEGGVDGFIIETVFDLREAVCIVQGCREASDLPILCLLAFKTDKDGGRTIMGNSAAQCAAELSGHGVAALGANCGDLTPLMMAEVIRLMRRETGLPLAAEPNAGLPRIKDGKTFFDMSPGEFVDGVAACIENGASIVGGCCGTGPLHIEALRKKLFSAEDRP